MNTLPGSMRAAGFQGTDGGLFYALATLVAWGDVSLPDVVDLKDIHGKKKEIIAWFDAEVQKVIEALKSNQTYTLVAISNDGRPPDKLGFRLGPPIVRRVSEAGLSSRVTLGEVLPESAYGK
jgi:hypothetical protein